MKTDTLTAQALRSTLGQYGWTVSGLADDATSDQVAAVAEGLLEQLASLEKVEPAQ